MSSSSSSFSTFSVGSSYTMRWIGDSSLITVWTCVKRTKKTVTLVNEHGEKTTRRVKTNPYSNGEYVSPFGVYSCSPSCYANNPA